MNFSQKVTVFGETMGLGDALRQKFYTQCTRTTTKLYMMTELKSVQIDVYFYMLSKCLAKLPNNTTCKYIMLTFMGYYKVKLASRAF